uniref:Reverse transcriptase n=1 Tax=Salvator merianae TaxID=96440 RepID=A0A8D0CF00_SALMN
ECFAQCSIHTKFTPQLLWETMKAVIRGSCISHSHWIHKQSKLEYEKLMAEIKQLEMQHQNTGSKMVLVQLSLFRATGIKTTQKSFWYLGVNIPLNLSKLFQCNYVPLWKKIKKDLGRWTQKNLLFLSRIAAVKMIIIPKLLYLFQTIPFYLPESELKKWERILNKFIFEGKRPRLAKKHYYKTKEMGGWGYPNLCYFAAFQIRHLFLSSHPSRKWWLKSEMRALLHSLLCGLNQWVWTNQNSTICRMALVQSSPCPEAHGL